QPGRVANPVVVAEREVGNEHGHGVGSWYSVGRRSARYGVTARAVWISDWVTWASSRCSPVPGAPVTVPSGATTRVRPHQSAAPGRFGAAVSGCAQLTYATKSWLSKARAGTSTSGTIVHGWVSADGASSSSVPASAWARTASGNSTS